MTLLLTSTLNPSFFNNISSSVNDVSIRRAQYEAALEFYLRESPFTRIIVAENSDMTLEEERFHALSESLGKNMEFVHCMEENPDRRKLGKSYGEAVLMHRAMEQSALLREADYFYKVTGRIIVRNIRAVFRDRAENCFVAYNFQEWVLTSFFKCKTDDFKRILDDAISRLFFRPPCLGPHLEHAYWTLLAEKKAEVKPFPAFPDLDGQVGGTGSSYRKSALGRFGRTVLNTLGFFSFREKPGIRDRILSAENRRMRR